MNKEEIAFEIFKKNDCYRNRDDYDKDDIKKYNSIYERLFPLNENKYKQALLDIKEIFTNYEELEKVIGAGKPRFPLYKVQRIVNKAIGCDK